MEAMLIDLDQITKLLNGKAPEASNILERIRNGNPTAWEFDPAYEETSEGAVLEALLTKKKWKGAEYLAGRALRLLCRDLGERLGTESFDDSGAMLVAEAFEGIEAKDLFYGRVPPPLKRWGWDYPIVGYLAPAEIEEVLRNWPEPDHDDPEPEVYAAREQIEGWLCRAADAKKSLIMFWE